MLDAAAVGTAAATSRLRLTATTNRYMPSPALRCLSVCPLTRCPDAKIAWSAFSSSFATMYAPSSAQRYPYPGKLRGVEQENQRDQQQRQELDHHVRPQVARQAPIKDRPRTHN